MGQHNVNRACTCCCGHRCGCLSGPGPAGTLVISLNDFCHFCCTFASEKTFRRGGT